MTVLSRTLTVSNLVLAVILVLSPLQSFAGAGINFFCNWLLAPAISKEQASKELTERYEKSREEGTFTVSYKPQAGQITTVEQAIADFTAQINADTWFSEHKDSVIQFKGGLDLDLWNLPIDVASSFFIEVNTNPIVLPNGKQVNFAGTPMVMINLPKPGDLDMKEFYKKMFGILDEKYHNDPNLSRNTFLMTTNPVK